MEIDSVYLFNPGLELYMNVVNEDDKFEKHALFPQKQLLMWRNHRVMKCDKGAHQSNQRKVRYFYRKPLFSTDAMEVESC
jgi:hypothetical protein